MSAFARAGTTNADSGDGSSVRDPLAGLYRDVLHHVCSFLTRKELAYTVRTQKRWLAAVSTMKSRSEAFTIRSAWQLDSLLTSPLRNLVRELHVYCSQLQSVTHLHRIGDAMPHLRELGVTLNIDDDMAEPRWPPALTKLWLEAEIPADRRQMLMFLGGRHPAHAVIARSLASVPCLRSLAFGKYASAISTQALEPLLALPSLTSLRYTHPLAVETMDVLRRLPKLREIACEQFTSSHLQRLLDGDDASIPLLESLPFQAGFTMDATTANLIVKLAPTLTELRPFLELPDPEWFLARMTKVAKLDLRVMSEAQVRVDSLVAGLCAMAQLLELELSHRELTSSHLGSILDHLPRLQSFIFHPTALVSLEFLAHAPRILGRLELAGGECIPIGELRYVDALAPHLARLGLYYIFDQRLDEACRERMTPGSSSFEKDKWPHLKEATFSSAR
jgi:hypothetical protein